MNESGRILVVDPDPKIVSLIKEWFKNSDFRFSFVETGAQAMDLIGAKQFDAVLAEFRLEEMGGMDLVRGAAQIRPNLPIVIIASRYDSRTAIEVVKTGAFDFLPKPLDKHEVHRSVEEAIYSSRTSAKVNIGQSEADLSVGDSLVGQSRTMLEVYKALGRLSATPVTVLIEGETGTGKELVARALFQHGHRSHKAYITVNCAAIPENLLESELFGHEKGAFTGAVTTRVGKFEQAHNATLFLDEIGDMDLALQAKLLRVLQEKRFQRVGGSSEISVDVRIIAATHRNLLGMVNENAFREDLYYRLNVAHISLPPLREREGDIPLLGNYFLERFCDEAGLSNRGITMAAIERLSSGFWPGNVRQLQNVIRKAALNARGYPIDERNIAILMEDQSIRETGQSVDREIVEILQSNDSDAHRCFLESFESRFLAEAIKQNGGNLSRTSEQLGMSRFTLREKLKSYGLRE